ncbi:unnamed protein product [Coffea canephora]|uniref:Uncharacterized protein n=1 Tax=Coffea canephora TaxID=49390 RepID=A0A068UTL7_COFCA|nr:unnamed protein product [Coffea canephora]
MIGAPYCLQLCIWNIDGWEKKKTKAIQAPPGHTSPLIGETKVQFHNDQCHLRVSHERHYENQFCKDSSIICVWVNHGCDFLLLSLIGYINSVNGLLVYTGFLDGGIGIFDADSLRLCCRIAPSAYMPSSIVRY